jgi:hypothetical protein
VFKSNPNLRGVNEKLNYTEVQQLEWLRCAEDVVYFAKNYIQIVSAYEQETKGKVQLFELWEFQEELIRLFDEEKAVIAKLPRQVGKSTTTIAFILHYILFREHVHIGLLANKEKMANELLHRLKFAYELLPYWLQQGIVTWNKGAIELENGARIMAASTSSSSVRGNTFDIIFLDEFAHVLPHLQEEFFDSVYPTIQSNKEGKVIIVSTPKGMGNKFFNIWNKSIQGKNNFKNFEVHWSQVPGRDEEWKKKYIEDTSEEQFRQEMECEFIGSSNTLIHYAKLRQMVDATIPPIRTEGLLRIWEDPIPGHTYVLMVDPSRGQNLDYHCFQVLDITTVPYKQVACYRDNKMPTYTLPQPIVSVATAYNMAFVLVEVNDIGQQVADMLHLDIGYENLIKTSSTGAQKGQKVSAGFTKRIQYGVRTTIPVKRQGCTNLKALIENNKLLIYDEVTVNEMLTFVAVKESFAAEEDSGCHDDTVMSLVLFGWLSAQKFFKEQVNSDMRRVLENELRTLMEADIAPFGFIDDGITEEVEITKSATGEVEMWHKDSDWDFRL